MSSYMTSAGTNAEPQMYTLAGSPNTTSKTLEARHRIDIPNSPFRNTLHAQKQKSMKIVNVEKLRSLRIEVLVPTATHTGSRLRYVTVGYPSTPLTIVHLVACRNINTACYMLSNLDRKLPFRECVVGSHCSATSARRSGG